MTLPARILIVDDETNLRFTLRLILEADGFEVVEAGDGHEAMELLTHGQMFDLVLTDLRMPGMDGISLLEKLLDLPLAPPTIMITANGDERVALQALKLGATSYIDKPFDHHELLRVVRDAMRASASW